MEQILVTGGTGTLGRVIVNDLVAQSTPVRVLSRNANSSRDSGASWSIGDLNTGTGVDAAVAGVEAIIHCASKKGDAESARHLIDAARRAGCEHLVYISIVGIDRIPLGYYRMKLEVERLIEDSGLAFTILRTTQFHNLLARMMATLARPPLMLVPAHTSFQPVEVREVASRLIELVQGPPAGRVTDMGGPEVRTTRDLARRYLDAKGQHRLITPLRLPGRGFAGFREGFNLAPDHAVGRIGFNQFLVEQTSNAPA